MSKNRIGRTIAAERERPVADSERMRERQRQRARKILRALFVLVLMGMIVWLVIFGVSSLIQKARREDTAVGGSTYILAAEIVDEVGAGVTASMRTFIEQMEADLAEYGYRLAKVVLPEGKMRQVNLYLADQEGYIKVRSDRGAGVQAEDIDRMIRYLGGQGYEYVDVRVEGKGYWKPVA